MTFSLENDLEELLSCAICLGTLSEPKLLPCSHRFCKLCVIMEMDRSATPKTSPLHFPCPLCKREIKLGRGRNGEEWVATFETDRLLKDIQDLLQQEKEDSSKRCLPHRKKRSLVCYSCGTTGCYICAWQDHRYCSNVKNFQAEAKQTKRDLQNHLKESEKCIEKMVPYVTKWSSVRKSLKNQRDYSNRFIEERLQHLHQESVSAVEELVQDYECYITRNRMSTEIEKELRRLMETFPIKINGSINIFNKQSGLQSQNETIILPEIQEALERLEIDKDVQMLISTVEDIRQILDLSMEEMVLKGKTLLTQKAKVLSKTYRDNLIQQMNVTPPRVVHDCLITRPEQINLGNERGERLLRKLKTGLRDSKNPKELVETIGRLCYPDGYCPVFNINPVDDHMLMERWQPHATHAAQSGRETPFEQHPVVDPLSKRRRQSNVLNKHSAKHKRRVACMLYKHEDRKHGRNCHKPDVAFCSYNSLHNKANGEPFPTEIEIWQRVIRKPSNLGPLPAVWHHFDNTDDEVEGLESARFTLNDIGNGCAMETSFSIRYGRESLCSTSSKAVKPNSGIETVFVISIFICIMFIFYIPLI